MGRRTTCTNNQKNIALALYEFQSTKGNFPQFRIVGDASYKGVCAEDFYMDGDGVQWTVLGWVPQVFPFMEQTQLFDVVQSEGTSAYTNVNIPSFQCPSAGGSGENLCNYVANCGGVDISDGDKALGKAVGMMTDGLNNLAKKVSIDDVKDGTTNTLLSTENMQAGTIWASQEYLNGFCWDVQNLANYNSNTKLYADGFIYAKNYGKVFPIQPYDESYPLPMKLNGGRDEEFSQMAFNLNTEAMAFMYAWARPSSSHPGIVVASMVDGSVRTVNEGVNWEVFARAMAPNDKAAGFDSKPLDVSKLGN